MDDRGRLLSGCRSKIRPRVRIPASPPDKKTAKWRFFYFLILSPPRVVIFRPTNSMADLKNLAILPDNRSVKMPDHLMDFRADNHHVCLGNPFEKRGKGQVHPFRLGSL